MKRITINNLSITFDTSELNGNDKDMVEQVIGHVNDLLTHQHTPDLDARIHTHPSAMEALDREVDDDGEEG
jgi:hypothetical protein